MTYLSLARMSWVLHTSRLQRRPYVPTNLSLLNTETQGALAKRACLRKVESYRVTAFCLTYSLISFSLSKGLLGFLDVLESRLSEQRTKVSGLCCPFATALKYLTRRDSFGQKYLVCAPLSIMGTALLILPSTYSSCTSSAFGRTDMRLIDIKINFK